MTSGIETNLAARPSSSRLPPINSVVAEMATLT